MIYPENLEQKLGFTQIREILHSYCQGAIGRNFVEKMNFSQRFDIVQRWLAQTNEVKQLISSGEFFPGNFQFNTQPILRKAEIENSYLFEDELHQLRQSLQTAADCLQFIKNKSEEVIPELKLLSSNIVLDKQLFSRIDLIIDENGRIKDSASSVLQSIRKTLISEQASLRKKTDSLLRNAKELGYLPDDAQPTIRSGRLVLPVLAEHKRHLKGFIHDESATGQTVYLEPAELFELNNLIRELELEEKREIFKILLQITNFIRPYIQGLYKVGTFLGVLDFLRAKARFAIELNAIAPKLEKKTVLDWKNARHPLLELHLKKLGKKIIGQQMELNTEGRLLIISGPNAGGKSVTLKTVGLLQYMLQSGLLIPVEEDSTAGIFEDIFIDIGDEQSIDNDLSTYSSHLSNMRQFLLFAGKKSLYLIDEFGTGTEPILGAAIAESILLELHSSKAFGIITTHYGNLKTFAERNEQVKNGAMAYDMEHLEPLYRLEVGRPGSSFAIEIASKTGLPKKVIDSARVLAGKQQIKMDELLRELEIERNKLREEQVSFRKQNAELNELLANNLNLQNLLDNKRKTVMNEAKMEAKRLLANTNQRIEAAIKKIAESKGDKEVIKLVREEVQVVKDIELAPEPILKEEVKAPSKEEIEEETKAQQLPLVVGAPVRLVDNGMVGEISALKGDTAEITAGFIKTWVKLSKLERISNRSLKKALGQDNPSSVRSINLAERMQSFSPTLDLRGARGEEALGNLYSYLDNALLLGVQEVRILHGKGDGILRKLVRESVKRNKKVVRISDEHPDRGGAGISIITLG